MAAVVSLAKTTRPSFAGVLQRERLFHALDRRRHSSLVWLTGPPGSGKTTLAASYVEARAGESFWYQLDAGDGDVGTFFYYLSELAVGGGQPKVAEGLPRYSGGPKTDPASFARRFFRAFYAWLPSPFVLVLDNYHEVALHSVFHEVLDVALSELPPESCMLVISRAEPPANLARRRANRDIELLGWNDLRLTRDESDAIIERWGAPGGERYLEQMYEKTQGWAAGLILMLDQGSSQIDPGAMDPRAPRVVFDYLAGEIFENFDRATQCLLLSSAYLPEMTAVMAAEISGHRQAAETLAELHHNYHLVGRRPGPDSPIYHYHPLLADFLVARLEVSTPRSELSELRRRSVACLERHGAVDEAAGLAMSTGDWNELSRLLDRHAASMIDQGREETLEAWLTAVPEARVSENPAFDLWRATCRARSSPREARLLFETAYEAFNRLESAAELKTAPSGQRGGAPNVDQPATRGLGAAAHCLAGVIETIVDEGDDLSLLDRWLGPAVEVSRDPALGGEPAAQARIEFAAYMALSLRRPEQADLGSYRRCAEKAAAGLTDAVRQARAHAFLAAELAGWGEYARSQERADACRSKCLDRASSSHLRRAWQAGQSTLASLQGNLDLCRQIMLDAELQDDALDFADHEFLLACNVLKAAIGTGELDAAGELAAQLRTKEGVARRVDRCTYRHACAWLAMRQGQLLEANQGLRVALRLAKECGDRLQELQCRLALADLARHSQGSQPVVCAWQGLRREARKVGNPLLAFQGLLLQAHTYFALDRARAAHVALAKGLDLGRRHGLAHHGWWHDEAMAELLSRALEAGTEVDYVRQLIRERDLAPPPRAVRSDQWSWRFQIYTLGRFRLLRDGRPLGLTARMQQKPLDLLKTLVAFGGDRVPEDKVAGALWPKIDPESAHRSLNTNLHRLRKLLGEDQAVVLKFGRLSLNRRYCWTDMSAFEEATAAADCEVGELEQGDGVVRSPPSEVAVRILDLYRGPFLAQERDAERYRAMRQRLRNRLLRSSGELARRWAAQANWQSCAAFFSAAIDADPQAEGLYRRLMLCYRDAGLAAEAMDVFEQCREMCAADQNAEPSPETSAVFQMVLQTL